MAAAAAAVKVASYGFVGRPPAGSIIHADYTAAEQRSFYYRDSLGTVFSGKIIVFFKNFLPQSTTLLNLFSFHI